MQLRHASAPLPGHAQHASVGAAHCDLCCRWALCISKVAARMAGCLGELGSAGPAYNTLALCVLSCVLRVCPVCCCPCQALRQMTACPQPWVLGSLTWAAAHQALTGGWSEPSWAGPAGSCLGPQACKTGSRCLHDAIAALALYRIKTGCPEPLQWLLLFSKWSRHRCIE